MPLFWTDEVRCKIAGLASKNPFLYANLLSYGCCCLPRVGKWCRILFQASLSLLCLDRKKARWRQDFLLQCYVLVGCRLAGQGLWPVLWQGWCCLFLFWQQECKWQAMCVFRMRMHNLFALAKVVFFFWEWMRFYRFSLCDLLCCCSVF